MRKIPGWEFRDLGSSAGSPTASLRAVATPRSASVFSFTKWTSFSVPLLTQVVEGSSLESTEALRKSQSAGGAPCLNLHPRLAGTKGSWSRRRSQGSVPGFLETYSGHLRPTRGSTKGGTVITQVLRRALLIYLLSGI